MGNQSSYTRNELINAFLCQHNEYIQKLARQSIPRSLVPPEILDLEIAELVQQVHIKLWQTLQKRSIMNPHAYIRVTVRTVAIDMIRRRKLGVPLLTIDYDDEFYLEQSMLIPEYQQDPVYEVEERELLAAGLKRVIPIILALPRRQRYAMLCTLKDQIDDIILLIDIFKEAGIDITTIHWPGDKDEVQRLKASLSASRKKLQLLRDYLSK